VRVPLRQHGGGACALRPASRAGTEVRRHCLINTGVYVSPPWRPRMLACDRRHHHHAAIRRL